MLKAHGSAHDVAAVGRRGDRGVNAGRGMAAGGRLAVFVDIARVNQTA